MSGKLFTPEERAICEKLADFKGELINKRAAILLLLDDGTTQSQACEQSGMSLGQLRYALTLFRKEGIAMFLQEEAAEAPAPKKEEKKKEVKEKKEKDTEQKATPKKKKPSEKDKKKAKKKLQKASKPKKKKKKKKKK